MSVSRSHIARVYASLWLLLTLSSCASYNNQAAEYYHNLKEGNYQKAADALDNTRLLKKNRNHLLYLLEKGKVSHLLQDWEKSNQYFNEADHLMEDARTSAKDIALGTLINPMMQQYKGEDFEKYLVHYYKALNYLQLGLTEEAMVEARRITLRSHAQEDKVGNKNKYNEDAFSLMLQGLIYEQGNDINNAFIAYRNAADVYIENKGSYYGVQMPEQLKKDLLRTAYANGFMDELGRYEKILETRFENQPQPEGGELVLFWENGSAPVKQQQDLFFTLFKDAGGNFMFADAAGLYNVPFDFSGGYNRNDLKLENLRSFRVALPKYEAQPLRYTGASVQLDDQSFTLEAAENVNNLAFATLKERMLKELSTTLTRLAVKKLAEAAVRPSEEKKDDKNKSEEQKKKEKKERNQREALAMGLQILNFATEKADTRNWQSLPHTIYYTRIPLRKGNNTINLQLSGHRSSSLQLQVEGNNRLQFRSISTIN